MPELIEAELYRAAAARCVGRTIGRVELGTPPTVRGELTPRGLARAVTGTAITAADRHGKVVLLRLSSARTLALRFGMTGRLVVDDAAPIEQLEYGPAGVRPTWIRLTLHFVEGGTLVLVDPRRLGWIEVDPDLSRLGPDAASISVVELRRALASSTAPLKARLLDQARVAGIGNLIGDETLFRAGIDPARAAGSLDADELVRLRRELRATIRALSRRGGSHTGELQAHRQPGASCPRCGVPLLRRTVGGRTTYSCPRHQR